MAAITQQQVLELFNVIGAISNSDEILMQSAQGNAAVKITAELFRAYLNQDFTITINEQGYWTVGGSSTGVQATPMMRNNNGDLEFSTDRGYTWHLLIPLDDLMPELTPEQIASLKVDLTDLTEEDIALLQAPAREAAAMAARLRELTLTVTAKGGGAGRLFGSVTSQEISDALKEQEGIDLDRRKIVIEDSIKTVGLYTVKVKLGFGIDAPLKVDVQEK